MNQKSEKAEELYKVDPAFPSSASNFRFPIISSFISFHLLSVHSGLSNCGSFLIILLDHIFFLWTYRSLPSLYILYPIVTSPSTDIHPTTFSPRGWPFRCLRRLSLNDHDPFCFSLTHVSMAGFIRLLP